MAIFVESSNDEVKDQSSGNGGRTQIVQGSLQALSRARPLAI